jgi:hypothetical protein
MIKGAIKLWKLKSNGQEFYYHNEPFFADEYVDGRWLSKQDLGEVIREAFIAGRNESQSADDYINDLFKETE